MVIRATLDMLTSTDPELVMLMRCFEKEEEEWYGFGIEEREAS
jgi:hypothetical protein